MDTLILNSKKTRLIVTIINVAIVAGVLLSQGFILIKPIFANEKLKLANSQIVSPILHVKIEKNVEKELTIQQKTKFFDEYIQEKYKNGTIYSVDRGVKHIKFKKYINKRPVKINVIEADLSLNKNLEIKPATSNYKTLAHKSTISSIAKENKSLVAINGTFFKPESGIPLGTLMIDKKLYTGPIYNRVAMGIFDDHFNMGRVQLRANLITKKNKIKIDNINQPRMLSTYTLIYTPEWNKITPASPSHGIQIAIKNNKIINISSKSQNIPKDGYVIVGPKTKLQNLKVGDNVKLDIKPIPDWDTVNHIISGGPYLIKNGEKYIDVTAEKLNAISGRNPRTAIGYTANNNIIMVTVDGREKNSIGMTLNELASFMKSIGCYNAMNLDGGGSTVLYVNGRITNQPSIKGGIKISNALTISKIN